MSKKKINSFSDLIKLKEIVFNLNKDNIKSSVEASMKFLDDALSYSFNITVSRLAYTSFVTQNKELDVIFKFLNSVEAKEKELNQHFEVFDVLSQFLLDMNSQESNYLLEKLVEQNLIQSEVVKNKRSIFRTLQTKTRAQF